MTDDTSRDGLAAIRAFNDLHGNPDPPKTEKGRRSREQLLAAARTVFARDGFAQARVQDIAEEAGFSLGAFYRYFDDKRFALMSLLADLMREIFDFSRSPWAPGDPERSVRITTERYLKMYEENSDLYRLMVEVAPVDEEVAELWAHYRAVFYERIGRALERGQRQGVVRKDLDADLVSVLLGGMTEHYAYLRFVVREQVTKLPRDVVAAQLSKLWADGAFVGPSEIANDGHTSDSQPPTSN